MAYQTETSLNYRRRSIKNDKPNNLQAGRAANGSYPGDKHFHSESVVSVQLHHIVQMTFCTSSIVPHMAISGLHTQGTLSTEI